MPPTESDKWTDSSLPDKNTPNLLVMEDCELIKNKKDNDDYNSIYVSYVLQAGCYRWPGR